MSKTEKKKTRLKGTDTKRPCVDCGKTRDRFKFFKPRWAGCAQHKTPNGRRHYKAGCEACEAAVNSNIRQPRCIDCDKRRPKKQRTRKASQAAAPTTVEPTLTAATVAKAEEQGVPVVELPGAVVTPEDVAGLPERVEPETPTVEEPETEEPQGETEVEAREEPSEESVTVPEPAPTPAPKAKAAKAAKARPAIASLDDLSKLFGGDDDA